MHYDMGESDGSPFLVCIVPFILKHFCVFYKSILFCAEGYEYGQRYESIFEP